MEMIDFINEKTYHDEPAAKEDKNKHPKIIVIAPEGTIYFADNSHDGQEIPFFNQQLSLENHTSYLNVLIKNYFNHNPMLIDNAKKNSLSGFYSNMMELVKEGYIFFNNMTSYIGPMYSPQRLSGQLLIPSQITSMQQEALQKISAYINYFKDIIVTEFSDDIHKDFYEFGSTAIENYLERHPNGKKIS